jgi:glycosyltransferase involved in cell wall biosynthesis
MPNPPSVSIVIPTYNSGKWLQELIDRVEETMKSAALEHEIILVNDFSLDNGETWAAIKDIQRNTANIIGVDLQRNSGQFNATMCGIGYSKGEIIVIMDDDFQHDPSDIPELIEPIITGDADCVMGVFENKRHSIFRNAGSLLVRWTYRKFHNLPNGIRMSPFRAITRKVANMVIRHRTSNPVLGAIILNSARKISNVTVSHRERRYGKSGYGFGRLVKSTLDNIFLATTFPLRMFTYFGMITLTGSIIGAAYYGTLYFTNRPAVPGFTTIVLLQLILISVISIGLGVLGEYVDRVIDEVDKRPRWHVSETVGIDDEIDS